MAQQITLFLKKLLDLREGAEEKHEIIERVKDDADFSSARFWTLVFAIGVCSVGLNINSIPVVIGAMLISPLMGPIVSIGLALSIYDWGLMRRSFRNLLTLTAISIFISALYFALSPIDNAQSELLSRIQPTIFDVLIAIFGGIAGFIGISRARQNNVIPGVAIATAIMPPLCTVGYGIGTLQPKFIIGAFYLFLINCIFICLSALLVAKYLKLPKREYPDEIKKNKVRRIISAIIIIIVTPALYLAYTFVEQNNFQQNTDQYILDNFTNAGHVVIYKNIHYNPSKTIELAFLSEHFSDEQIQSYKNLLPLYGLEGADLIVRQNGFSLTKEEWQKVVDEAQSDNEKLQTLELLLENEQKQDPVQLLAEAKLINEKIIDISIGELMNSSQGGGSVRSSVVIVRTDKSFGPISHAESEVLRVWLSTRLNVSNLNVYFELETKAATQNNADTDPVSGTSNEVGL